MYQGIKLQQVWMCGFHLKTMPLALLKKLLSVLPRLQPGQLVQAQLQIEEAKGWLACLGPLISLLELSYEHNKTYNCTPQGGPAGKALKSLTAKTLGWVCWFGTGDDFPFHLRVSFAEAYLQEWSLRLEQRIPWKLRSQYPSRWTISFQLWGNTMSCEVSRISCSVDVSPLTWCSSVMDIESSTFILNVPKYNLWVRVVDFFINFDVKLYTIHHFVLCYKYFTAQH